MPFREKIKQAFARHSLSPQDHKEAENPKTEKQAATTKMPKVSPQSSAVAAKTRFTGLNPRKRKLGKNGKPKIELYKPHEVPPSKFRGPFDPVHMKKLADYSISDATADRRRSVLSELSPTTKVRESMDCISPTTAVPEQMPELQLVIPEPTASLTESTSHSPTQTFEKDVPSQTPDRASDTTSVTHDGRDAFSSLTLGSSYTADTSHHSSPESAGSRSRTPPDPKPLKTTL